MRPVAYASIWRTAATDEYVDRLIRSGSNRHISGGGITRTEYTLTRSPTLAVLLAQPAIVTLPLAFAVMVGVSLIGTRPFGHGGQDAPAPHSRPLGAAPGLCPGLKVRRVSIVGNAGAGKTRLARALAARLGVPHIELDALNYQANWTPTPPELLRAEVARRLGTDGWVVDGNYFSSGVQDVVWARADTVIWVDLRRAVVMWQVIVRSLRRAIRREVLWNGKRQPWRDVLPLDPQSVIVGAWTHHGPYRDRYAAVLRDPAWSHLHFVRLRSRRDAARLLCGL